jgi:CheY-like chemotaxis protein
MEQDAGTPHGGAPLDIVVTDDDRESADSLAEMLLLDGHAVRASYDGEGCLEAVDAKLPDVVLLDLGMPGLDGFATCRAIRERHGRDVRVLAVTGWDQLQDVAEAARAGFDGHLLKPVDPAKLAEGLSGLGRNRATGAAVRA